MFHVLYMTGFVLSLFLLISLYRFKRNNLGLSLHILIGLTSFWLLMEGISYIVQNNDIIIFAQKIKYVSIIFIPPTLLVTGIIFIWKHEGLSKKKILLIYALPFLSFLSLVTNTLPYPFISNVSIEHKNHIQYFIYDKNIGFYIHTLTSYILILTNNVFLFYRIKVSPRIYKTQSIFVFLGSFLCVVANAIFITDIFKTSAFDTTPLSVLLTLAIFHWGEHIYTRRSIIPHARNLVVENMTDLVIITAPTGAIIDVNPTGRQRIIKGSSLFDEEDDRDFDFTDMSIQALADSFTVEGISKEHMQLYTNQVFHIEIDKTIHHLSLSIEAIKDSHQKIIAYLYLFKDITTVQNTLDDLLKMNKDLTISDTIINQALEGIVITDKDNKIIRTNKSLEVMTGFKEEELIGENPRLFKSDQHPAEFYEDMWSTILSNGYWAGEIWDRKKCGAIYPKRMSIKVIRDNQNEISHYIGISSDVSEMKKAQEDIHTMAYYDKLTALPNRTLFNDRLKTALYRRERNQSVLALVSIDLDRFKSINDAYGHSVGDQYLIEVSQRINKRIRKSDTLSRLGGDEFTVILENIKHTGELSKIINNIYKEFRMPCTIQGHDLAISASVGIAVSPDDDTQGEGLLRKADYAMTHAKKLGGNQYFFSSEDLETKNKEMIYLSKRLKEAIKNKEFQLHLQPQVGLVDKTLTLFGAEALIRWPQEDGSMIPPDKFIPLAETTGMIKAIGLWVLEEAFMLKDKLEDQGIFINMACNVSVRQFESPDLLDHLKGLLNSRTGKSIDFSIEITESLLFNDVDEAIRNLQEIKDLGVSIALDDFGTGYSSMSYLSRLPMDYLKIDRSFINEIKADNQKSLAYMILSMAKTLDLKTVAEGVETQEQAKLLFEAHCEVLQGYYYGKPMALHDFIDYAHSLPNTK